MVREALRAQGKDIHFLDPARPKDAKTWGFNVLDWIDVGSELAEMHVHTVVSWIFAKPSTRESPEQAFFHRWGKDMVACLLAHLFWDDKATAPKTLATLRVVVATPERRMRKLLRAIGETSNSVMARQIAGSLSEVVDETFSGIYADANQGTAWLSVPAFADLVSGDAFRTADLLMGATTVFVQIPLPALITTPGLGRVIIGSLLNAVYQANGELKGRVLFLLDEVARLGRMKVLEAARDVGRKYGITLQLQGDQSTRSAAADHHIGRLCGITSRRARYASWWATPTDTKLRSSKYLNNLIEQDHRGVKLRIDPMLGFKRFETAAITIAGIELLRRIHKGQFNLRRLRLKGRSAPAIWNAVLAA